MGKLLNVELPLAMKEFMQSKTMKIKLSEELNSGKCHFEILEEWVFDDFRQRGDNNGQ